MNATAFAGALLLFLWVSSSFRLAADSTGPLPDGKPALTPTERSLVASVPYSSVPIVNRSGVFDTRFSVAQGFEWRDIYDKPQIITLTIGAEPGDPQHAESIGDVEGVFPIRAEYYFEALEDYNSYPQISSRTVYDVGRGRGSGPLAYHKRIMKISAQFLGFGDTYLFVTNNYEERLARGSYGLEWNLEKSLDKKFYSLMGSWYLRSLRCNGAPCTYVRYFNRTGFTRRPPIPDSILAFFTAKSFRSLLEEFYQEAVTVEQRANGQAKSHESNDILTIR